MIAYSVKLLSIIMAACFFSSVVTAASSQSGELRVNSTGDGLLFCMAGGCKAVALPDSFSADMDAGYEDITTKVFGGQNFALLSTANDVNSCAKLYGFNGATLALIAENIDNFCNAKIERGNVVTSYRSSDEWHEVVFSIANGGFKVLYEDECIGCGQVTRSDFTGLTKTNYLVNDAPGFYDRNPLQGIVDIERSPLYKLPGQQYKSHLYLVSGDAISLLDSRDLRQEGLWYKVRYERKDKDPIIMWMSAPDLKLK
jgi:hypothetical protein